MTKKIQLLSISEKEIEMLDMYGLLPRVGRYHALSRP